MGKIMRINELDDLNNLGNKLENNSQINWKIPKNYENTLRSLPWPIGQGQVGIKIREGGARRA